MIQKGQNGVMLDVRVLISLTHLGDLLVIDCRMEETSLAYGQWVCGHRRTFVQLFALLDFNNEMNLPL